VDATPDLLKTVEDVPGVEHAAPFIYSEMMIRSRFGTSGVVFKGVDPERTGAVTEVLNQIQRGVDGKVDTEAQKRAVFTSLAGTLTGAGPDGDTAYPTMIVGNELATDLQVEPGDVVQVINPLGSGPSMMGMPTPTVRSFRVAGIFHSGMFEYDTKWTYVSVAAAQDFLKQPDTVTGIEIRVKDIDGVEPISREIEGKLGYPFYARHWRNLNQSLFEALALEKLVMGLILSLISGVAGLLIISNLYMMVLTKRREIAILKAMGAGAGTVLRVFVMVGAVIGLVGATLGTLLGYAGCLFLAWYEWPLETDVYYLSSLPVVFAPENFASSAVVALLICLLATVYPAYRAASLDPVEGLRYE
jgi:lipoprotein-releasing system permease protein